MTDLEPRFLVLERWMGRTIPRTDRLVREKRAAKIPITPVQAMMGFQALLAKAMEDMHG